MGIWLHVSVENKGEQFLHGILIFLLYRFLVPSASLLKPFFFLYPKDQSFGFWDDEKGGRDLTGNLCPVEALGGRSPRTVLQSSCVFAV